MKTAQHVSNSIRYVTKDKVDLEDSTKIYRTLSTYINTSPYQTANEWETVRKGFAKNEGNLAFQIIQSFGEDIDPVLANKIGVEFSKELLGNRQIIVSTHTNTPNVHNHILFNSPDLERGQKYYDNKETYYKQVRRISDKLCEKYGLKVLENTREGTFKFYKDEKGSRHYFEPTERKKRNFNYEYSKMEEWRKSESILRSKRMNIINDMEIIIPLSKSYEDFISKMKNIGYEVKDKTSNGEWRKHISFKPPQEISFFRDTSKGMKGYSREEITKRIDEQQSKKEKNNQKENDIETVTTFDVEEKKDILYHWEQVKNENNSDNKEIKNLIIKDLTKLNKEIDIGYAMAFKPEQNKNQTIKERRQSYVIDKINSEIRTLNFVTEKKIDTFEQLENRMNDLKEKRDMTVNSLEEIRNKLKTANEMLLCIEHTNKFEEHIAKQKEKYGDAYLELEEETEIELFHSLKKELAKANLETKAEQEVFKNKIDNYKRSYETLVVRTQEISDSLKKTDDIYRTLRTIDSENGNYYKKQLDRYEQKRFEKNEERSQMQQTQNRN